MGDTAMIHTYDLAECVAFSHPKRPWGEFSNFSQDFPLRINGVAFATTEHLYQACRFPHLPELQKDIHGNPSPLAAKMRAHKHESETRPDWEGARVPIMRWCLAVKLAQHRATFGALLLSTGDRPLVEVSTDDAFWGAAPDGPGSRSASGANMLGDLLMDLRATLSAPAGSEVGDGDMWVPAPPSDLGLRLFGQPIVGERTAPQEDSQQDPEQD
jgi:type I restriction enzyme, S subunit